MLNDIEYANSSEFYFSRKDGNKEIMTLNKTFNFATSQLSFSHFSPRQSHTGTVKFIEAKKLPVSFYKMLKSLFCSC